MPASSGPELLPPALLADIAAGSAIRRFPAHAVLITEGDASDALFIIVSGRVKVYAAHEGGREVILNSHGPGEIVGELALDGGPRSASVMTTEPTSCAVVSGARLRDFIVAHPDFALHLIHHLIARVRGLTGSVKSLALDDVYARVTGLLQRLSVAEGRLARWGAGVARPADPTGHRRPRRRVKRDGQPRLQGAQPRWIYRGCGRPHPLAEDAAGGLVAAL
jgi:CRP/FNR family cyclic AMP-dependent transcriptional regulator